MDFRDKTNWEFFGDIFDGYTRCDMEIINKVEYIEFFTHKIRCCLRETDFISIEGVKNQIEKFTDRYGLVYYVTIKDGKANLESRAVEVVFE